MEHLKNRTDTEDRFRELFQAFWRIQEEEIKNQIGSVLDSEKQEILELEKNFEYCVLKKMDEWSVEKDVLVLWDIDDTMGQYRKRKDKYVFYFRPGFQKFMSFILQNFQGMIHGILSDRKEEELAENFHTGEFADTKFFQKEMIISSRKSSQFISEEAKELYGGINSSIGVNMKINKMAELRKKYPNLKVKLIDDFLEGDMKLMGKDGLSVRRFIPRLATDAVSRPV
jgi:hypothetical protein